MMVTLTDREAAAILKSLQPNLYQLVLFTKNLVAATNTEYSEFPLIDMEEVVRDAEGEYPMPDEFRKAFVDFVLASFNGASDDLPD
jgi:hypothetical protein